jgi:hypothetical protein
MVFIFKFGNKYKKLTLKRLLEVLEIYPEKGKCYWKSTTNRRIKIGSRAGTIHKNRSKGIYYRIIGIDGKHYREHILIWFFVHKKWPSRDLDHKNMDGLDNRYKNLRLATKTQNNVNKIKQVNNTSGFKGVHWNKRDKKWIARIGYKGKRICSKGYDDPYVAYLWYCKMHKKLFGEFSRTK